MPVARQEKLRTPTTALVQRRAIEPVAPTHEHDRATAVRDVQRVAGNAGLTALVAQRRTAAVVQRLSTTSVDFDREMGKSNTRGAFGKGASHFALVRKALADYEKAKTATEPGGEAKVVLALERVSKLAADWLNTHKGSSPRHTLLRTLIDQVLEESASLSKKQAEKRYFDSLLAGARPMGNVPSPVADDFEHQFQVAGGSKIAHSSYSDYKADINTAKILARDTPDEEKIGKEADEHYGRRLKFRETHCISAAEEAAIRFYTSDVGFYQFVTAASANDNEWLAGVQKNATNAAFRRRIVWKDGKQIEIPVDFKTIKEEGALHAAMATRGIMKLPPYKGRSYRAESLSTKEFNLLKVGKPHTFKALTSTSKNEGRAGNFLTSTLSDKRPISVMWKFINVGGRDVSTISELSGEEEVLLPPSTTVNIVSIRFLRSAPIFKGGTGKIYEIDTLPVISGGTPALPTVPNLPKLPDNAPAPPPAPDLPPLPPLPPVCPPKT